MLDLSTFLLSNKNILLPNANYLIAVSGGVDSMALLELCKNAQLNIQVAHVNYTLRGADSDADAAFVENYCKTNNIIFYKKVVDTNAYMHANKLGLQEAARTIRYTFFQEIIKDVNTKILTGHHANDNIETVLMQIARGTGFNGLTGIAVINKNIIRPLLQFTKEQIIGYAKANNITYRQDASNDKNIYTRNAIRNVLIPTWTQLQPNFEQNMLQNIGIWNQANEVYKQYVNKMLKKLLVHHNGVFKIPIKLLIKQGNVNVWLYEILSKFEFSTGQILEVEKLLKAENGKYFSNHINKVFKDNDFLIVSPLADEESNYILIDSLLNKINYKSGSIVFQQISKPNDLKSESNVVYVNPASLQLPLKLRPAKEGDYFYPLGLAKKKKIAKFLIDQKLSQLQKDNIWVLESNKKIVWVINERLDERYKVKDSNDHIIKIKFEHKNG